MTRLFPLILSLGLAACGNPDYPPPDPLPADLTTCEQPSDCVAVELGCCDSCNGGTRVAVRADKEAEVIDTYAESCGNGVACTEMACELPVADCVDSVCTLVFPEPVG